MSQYDDLDAAILARIDAGHTQFINIHEGAVLAESRRLADQTGRAAFRVVDGRLQSLRKRGLIEFARGFGWLKRASK